MKPVLRYPAAALTEPCEPVIDFDESLQGLVEELLDTCTEYQGIGLAAPQIGINRQVVVICEPGQAPRVLVNPAWTPLHPGQVETADEGCLSLPGLQVEIERSLAIRVEALTPNREPLVFEAEGLLARIIQHECEHLDGRTIVDHLASTKRSLVLHAYRKNLKKQTRRFNAAVKGRVA